MPRHWNARGSGVANPVLIIRRCSIESDAELRLHAAVQAAPSAINTAMAFDVGDTFLLRNGKGGHRAIMARGSGGNTAVALNAQRAYWRPKNERLETAGRPGNT